MTRATPDRDVVPFRQAVRAWFAISLQTFSGPAGQIAVTGVICSCPCSRP